VLLAPWEDDDPELTVDSADDEPGFQRVMEMLLAELEQHAKATYRPDSVVWEHGDFVASTMLQWKGGYHDGRLGRWTRADLAEYLLDYFPRKVSVDHATLAAVPDCVRAFLGFLDDRGSLTGEPLEQLQQGCEQLRDEFHQRARDRSHWGLAKSMVMQMHAEGLDPGAPGALDAWITDFNTPPPAARPGHRPRRRPHGPRRGTAPHHGPPRTQTTRPATQGPARRAQTQPTTLTPPGLRRSTARYAARGRLVGRPGAGDDSRSARNARPSGRASGRLRGVRKSEHIEGELLAAAANLSNPGEGWPDPGTMTLRLAGALGPLAGALAAAQSPATPRPQVADLGACAATFLIALTRPGPSPAQLDTARQQIIARAAHNAHTVPVELLTGVEWFLYATSLIGGEMLEAATSDLHTDPEFLKRATSRMMDVTAIAAAWLAHH
jgi:hypothetical protein